MERFVTPNDYDVMGSTDSESIQKAVAKAVQTGVRRVLIPSFNERSHSYVWDIDTAIGLASDLEIVLDNCFMRQADGCMDNIFRSFSDITKGHTPEERLHNVRIIGRGKAQIDGGLPNGLREGKTDNPKSISCNNIILLYNVTDFVIENILLTNQRWWAINLIHADHGRISNVRIHCECDQYNQDGVDLREGCHDIILENITGTAGDDFIALSSIGTENGMYTVNGVSEDIHDITLRNIVATSACCALISLRCSDGRRIYNVNLDNINDVDNGAVESGKLYPDYPKAFLPFGIRRNRAGNSPYALIRIGQAGFFKKRPCMLGEMYNISATNLYAKGGCVVLINTPLDSSYFGNIHAENGVDYILTTKNHYGENICGADIRNTVFENIFYNNTDNDFATAFDIDVNTPERTVENLVIKQAFLGNCKNIIHLCEKGNVIFQDIFGANVKERSGEIWFDGEKDS